MNEYRKILDNLRGALLKEKDEAVLISSQTSQRYISGFDYTDGYILILRESVYLLADFRYIEAAKAQVSSDIFEVVMPEGKMLSEIALLCAVNGIKKLYTEESALTCSAFERMKNVLKDVSLLHGASDAIDSQRREKFSFEIEKISRAQSITDKAFAYILGILDPKMTEVEVALELEFFMRRNGAEAVAFDTIAVSGTASSRPHGVPRNIPLERGFLTMDFGARVDGYCSDMTRTVAIGKADDEMKRLYNTVLSAQLAALDVICEGVECKAADTVARDIINNAGYEGRFGHSLGHGVGMFVHESPRLSQSAKDGERLTKGCVVTVEPGIYIEGKYGCRIEDMIAIDNDGKFINFTKSPKELIEI